MSNFRRFWCSFTCSPYQSSFVEVTSSSICDQTLHPGPNKNQGGGCEGTPSSEEQKPTAQSVVVKVDAVYASELFESCKSVTVAATGQRVMDLVSSWSHQTFKNKHAVSLSLSLPPSFHIQLPITSLPGRSPTIDFRVSFCRLLTRRRGLSRRTPTLSPLSRSSKSHATKRCLSTRPFAGYHSSPFMEAAPSVFPATVAKLPP